MSNECLNCEAKLNGTFCSECGQPASTGRYSFRALGNEIYGQFRKLDISTTAKTFWELIRRPGEFVHSYLAGRRVGFLNPVKFFFYSFVANVLVSGWIVWLTNDRQFEATASGFRYEIASFVSTIFWGLLWALFYRRSKLNTVENIVAAILFVGQANFLSLIGQVATAPFVIELPAARNYFEVAQLGVYVVYSFFFSATVFRDPWYLLIPKQLVLVLMLVIVAGLVAIGSSLI